MDEASKAANAVNESFYDRRRESHWQRPAEAPKPSLIDKALSRDVWDRANPKGA